MVSVLKHRIALAVLVGVLVIPILSVNNGGLSHLLFCEATVTQSFAVASDSGGPGETNVTSSTRLTLDQPTVTFEGDASVTPVCDGVTAEVTAEPLDSGRVTLTVTIHNRSELPWRGSVGLAAEGQGNRADLTAAIGEVRPGEDGSASLELRVPAGQTEIAGTLLLGP